MTLFLYDIDGTLVQTGGVGRRSMARAGERLFGHSNLFDGLTFAGALDPLIVSRGLAWRGIAPTGRRLGRLRRTYLRELTRRMPNSQGSVMPGVREALEATREVATIGLLSGNWRLGARLKLEHFDLWRLFDPLIGAFGDDALYRDELVPVGWKRATRLGAPPRRIVVIGDTAADVHCARSGGLVLAALGVEVLAVGVGTGWATMDELEAAEPDLLIPDLAQGLEMLLSLA